MSIVHKLKGLHGVKNYLEKNNCPIDINNDKELNQLFLLFAKDMNKLKEFSKPNKKNYRGSFNPTIHNGYLVSCNFKEFKEWYKTLNLQLCQKHNTSH